MQCIIYTKETVLPEGNYYSEEDVKSLLEKIDIKAEAGLCYFTLDSARAFLKDIRNLVKEAKD